MTPERLKTLLAAYGADPRRWPDRERRDAELLMAGNKELRRWLREADVLDQWLETSHLPPAGERLRAHVLAVPRTNARVRPVHWWQIWWPEAAAVIAAGLFGFFVGSQLWNHPEGQDPEVESMEVVSYTGGDGGWDR